MLASFATKVIVEKLMVKRLGELAS